MTQKDNGGRGFNTSNPYAQARLVLSTQWEPYGYSQYPVDPVIVARNLGINVYKRMMDAGTSGYIVKRAESWAPDIFVNSEHAPVRQRFTVAHELGHFFKRLGMSEDQNKQYALKRAALAACGTDQEEIYANRFAAGLLMPEDAVVELVDRNVPDLDAARLLQVSVEAFRHRKTNLGLK